jgi:hypothetical protein
MKARPWRGVDDLRIEDIAEPERKDQIVIISHGHLWV